MSIFSSLKSHFARPGAPSRGALFGAAMLMAGAEALLIFMMATVGGDVVRLEGPLNAERLWPSVVYSSPALVGAVMAAVAAAWLARLGNVPAADAPRAPPATFAGVVVVLSILPLAVVNLGCVVVGLPSTFEHAPTFAVMLTLAVASCWCLYQTIRLCARLFSGK